jgi:flagellar biosynthesis protein
MKPQEFLQQVVALGYEHGTPAPKVLAQGRGDIAQAILDRAKELDIPIRAEPDLVAFLMLLDLNEWVPPELYAAVAEVLAWAYGVDRNEN